MRGLEWWIFEGGEFLEGVGFGLGRSGIFAGADLVFFCFYLVWTFLNVLMDSLIMGVCIFIRTSLILPSCPFDPSCLHDVTESHRITFRSLLAAQKDLILIRLLPSRVSSIQTESTTYSLDSEYPLLCLPLSLIVSDRAAYVSYGLRKLL